MQIYPFILSHLNTRQTQHETFGSLPESITVEPHLGGKCGSGTYIYFFLFHDSDLAFSRFNRVIRHKPIVVLVYMRLKCRYH